MSRSISTAASARLRQRGGDLIVSFGGVANDELARRCTDEGLYAAYSEVIKRYKLTAVDFDIEGAALDDDAANDRRARVVKRLQAEARKAHRNLAVWLTAPGRAARHARARRRHDQVDAARRASTWPAST